MPPKATMKQARTSPKSLARGTPAREKIAWTLASDIVREIT